MYNTMSVGFEKNGGIFFYTLHRIFGSKKPTIIEKVEKVPEGLESTLLGTPNKDVYVSSDSLAGVYKARARSV